jgi:hypothetical protein
MKCARWFKIIFIILLVLCSSISTIVFAQQEKSSVKFKKASRKIETGFERNNQDSLAQGYFDLGDSYYQNGDLLKAESYYQKSKNLYAVITNAEGIAKSSRALAKIQEELNKNKEAVANYNIAQENNFKTGDSNSIALNGNDIKRLMKPDSMELQRKILIDNINRGLKNNDTNEVALNYSRIAGINLKKKETKAALSAYSNAYNFSKNNPQQALRYNQLITDVYVKDKNFSKAIETKQEAINQPFVQNSTQVKSREITSLADIYIQKKEDNTAINLLNESYALAVANGHTLEAKKCIEKLDSLFQNSGRKDLSLNIYKRFLGQLPGIIEKDSSLIDEKIIQETEEKLRKLETEKAVKDDLIRRKNILNYWLIGSIIVLVIFAGVILYILKKLQIKNKKIALQSLRREMNPHFIFNSLNSINQFIANNNELEANQYLTRFSTLMRRVMENSKDDFVLFSKETELLQHYLELEKSRFPDKFNFNVKIDDALLADEQLYIPGMLIQPYLENAIWHGLRYMRDKGFLQLSFEKRDNQLDVTIEDNGIGIAESKKSKTANQKQHSGRGITNTLERIKILNELYHQNITCQVQDKPAPETGVRVSLTIPLSKKNRHEN